MNTVGRICYSERFLSPGFTLKDPHFLSSILLPLSTRISKSNKYLSGSRLYKVGLCCIKVGGGCRDTEMERARSKPSTCLVGSKVLTRGEGNRPREAREHPVYGAPMSRYRQKVLSKYSEDKHGSPIGSIAPEALLGR